MLSYRRWTRRAERDSALSDVAGVRSRRRASGALGIRRGRTIILQGAGRRGQRHAFDVFTAVLRYLYALYARYGRTHRTRLPRRFAHAEWARVYARVARAARTPPHTRCTTADFAPAFCAFWHTRKFRCVARATYGCRRTHTFTRFAFVRVCLAANVVRATTVPCGWYAARAPLRNRTSILASAVALLRRTAASNALGDDAVRVCLPRWWAQLRTVRHGCCLRMPSLVLLRAARNNALRST